MIRFPNPFAWLARREDWWAGCLLMLATGIVGLALFAWLDHC